MEGGYRGKGELTGWGEDGGSGALTGSAASCACLLRGLNGTHCAGEDGWMWADAAGDAVRCNAGIEEEPDDADDPPGLLRSAPATASHLPSASPHRACTWADDFSCRSSSPSCAVGACCRDERSARRREQPTSLFAACHRPDEIIGGAHNRRDARCDL